MKNKRRNQLLAFSLTELLTVVVISGLLVTALYGFLARQRKTATIQNLKATTESLAQLAFFIIGRDIRRAGSNPAGAMGYSAGAEIPIGIAQNDQIQIFADLNGNRSIDANTDENITYQFVDDPVSPDGVKDRIMRQSGNNLVIENIRTFDIKYQVLGSSTWITSTAAPEMIRLVRLHMVAGTGKINPQTNLEDTKEIQMDYLLRNFR